MKYQESLKHNNCTCARFYSHTADILFMNKIVGEREELNRETLLKVKMPNRDGFVRDPRPDVK